MSLSYYDVRRKRQRTGLAQLWMALNSALAVVMAFYWSGIGAYVAEPFKWAMREGVSTQPSLFEYPYLTLWSTPLLCVIGGWLALKAEQASVARIVGSYPTIMLGMMLGWYYLAPPHWH
jgi:hypothetical protein